MTAPSITRMSPTQYKALTAAIRAGSLVMRGQDYKSTTLIGLKNRGWVEIIWTVVDGVHKIDCAKITNAGRHAVARFAKTHGHGVDPHRFPATKPLDLARLDIPAEPDLLDQLLPE